MSAVEPASFAALGTTVSVLVTDPGALGEATELVRAHVADLDQAASRFRPDSELSRLNAAAGRSVPVSPLLLTAVTEALRAAAETDGLLNPTVGHAVELSGYDRDFDSVAPDGPRLVVRCQRVPGWRAVRVDPARSTVRVPFGVRLDLGATAKAGCADRAAQAVHRLTGAGTLVNLGGDLAVAGPTPEGGWAVRVTDRHDAPADEPGVTVALRSGGMATSGTAARRWRRGGRLHHHVIDPATGLPAATCWRTVSVVADTCLAANTAATAAIVLGAGAPAWLGARGRHARLVAEDGTVTGVGDWPAAALAPAPAPDRRLAAAS